VRAFFSKIFCGTTLCKNKLRHWWRKRETLEDFDNLQAKNTYEIDETLGVVIGLPNKYI